MEVGNGLAVGAIRVVEADRTAEVAVAVRTEVEADHTVAEAADASLDGNRTATLCESF